MIKKFHKLKAKRGFTLVELIVVIAIIGVLAAILIPTLTGIIESARKRGVESTCHDIHQMAVDFQTTYAAKYGEDVTNSSTDLVDMDIDNLGPISFNEYVVYNIPELKKAQQDGSLSNRFGVQWSHSLISVWYQSGSYKAEWLPGVGQQSAVKVP